MKIIGIIGAMPSELVTIRNELEAANIKNVAKFDFHVSEHGEATIINVCCGIGKVNAAICTQILIDQFQVDAIINTGIAGGMSDETQICDIVVSSDVMHHDLIPRFLEDYPPYNSVFTADKRLISQATKSCDKHGIRYFVERIVSGEVFVSSNERRQEIIDEYDPYAVDMETAAIAQCAFRNGIPFVSVRCISDHADDDGEMTFDEFEVMAADRVATVVLDMVENL